MPARIAIVGCVFAVGCGVGEPVDPASLPDRTREVGNVALIDAAGGLRDRRGIAASTYDRLTEFYFVDPHGISYADAVYEDNRRFWSPDGDVGDVTATALDTSGVDRVFWATPTPRGRGVWSVYGGNQPQDLRHVIDLELTRMAVSARGTAVAALSAVGPPTLHVRTLTTSWERSGDNVPLWVADDGATVLVALTDSTLGIAHAPGTSLEPVTPPVPSRALRVVTSVARVGVLIAELRGGDTTVLSVWNPLLGTRTELGATNASWRAPALDPRVARAVIWTTRDGGAHWSLVLLESGSAITLLERAGDLRQMRPWESLFANGYVAWSWGDGRLRVTAIP